MKKYICMKIIFIFAVLFAYLECGAVGQFDLKVCRGKKAYYFAEHDIMKGDPNLEYAVIYIHGAKGGARDVARGLRRHLKKYNRNKHVYCIAPSFFTKETCPPEKADEALIWRGGWRGGDSAVNGNKISNFEVIDRIYSVLSDPSLYPSMKRITLCGFSAGGQCVNRYVAVGKIPLKKHVECVFVVGNPSIYLYIDKKRFENGRFRNSKSRSNFNQWFMGLDKRFRYCKGLSKREILENLSSRKTLYFCGTADTDRKMLDVGKGAMTQGKNRYERFQIYQKYTALFPSWKQAIRFISVPGIAHSSAVFYKDNILQKWVFGESFSK